MRVLIQRNLKEAVPATWFAGLSTVPFDGPRLPARVDAEVVGLALRSTTPLTASDLSRLPGLRIVATASSGVDHLDEQAIAAAGVSLVTGRGGNAEAVADWIQWALARAFKVPVGAPLHGRRVVVVGVGAVGSAVVRRLQALQADVVPVDPPRAARECGFRCSTLEQALATPCDVLTLHVPLTHAGAHPTAALIDAAALRRLSGAVLLNAARGGVVDEQEAVRSRQNGRLSALMVDTFQREPRPEIAGHCDLATPHIAGHSMEGRLRVGWLAIDGLRRGLGLPCLPSLTNSIASLRGAISATGQQHRPASALDATSNLLAELEQGADFSAIRSAHSRLEMSASRR